MATAILTPSLVIQKKSRKKPEFVAPSYALRGTSAPAELPKDQLGREIALLLSNHPTVAKQIGALI